VQFSVIIPTYNRLQYLPCALESVWRQTIPDFEVIVVDDGSTDGTGGYLQRLKDRVQIVRQANGGPGAARNAGVALALGEYVAFLDSDDLWLPWTLAVYRKVVEECSAPALIGGQAIEFREPEELAHVREGEIAVARFPDYFRAATSDLHIGSNQAVIRRDAFDAVGGFTTRRINAEDHDLVLRLGAHAGCAFVSSPPQVGYRRHQNAATGNHDATYAGVCYLLEQERAGRFPGGEKRRREREIAITRVLRPVMIESLRRGQRGKAWNLYLKTLGWHARQRRLKFLLGFPVVAARYLFVGN